MMMMMMNYQDSVSNKIVPLDYNYNPLDQLLYNDQLTNFTYKAGGQHKAIENKCPKYHYKI